jgi:hypothetical protein
VGLTAELEQMKQAQAQSAQEAEAVAAEMEKANTERDQALAQGDDRFFAASPFDI